MFGFLKSAYKVTNVAGGISVACRDKDIAGKVRAALMLSGKTQVDLGLDGHNCSDPANLTVTIPGMRGEQEFGLFYKKAEQLETLVASVGKSMKVGAKHVGVRYSSTQRQCFPYIDIPVTAEHDPLKTFRTFIASATGAEIHTRNKGINQTVMDIYAQQGVDMLTPLLSALEHKASKGKY